MAVQVAEKLCSFVARLRSDAFNLVTDSEEASNKYFEGALAEMEVVLAVINDTHVCRRMFARMMYACFCFAICVL